MQETRTGLHENKNGDAGQNKGARIGSQRSVSYYRYVCSQVCAISKCGSTVIGKLTEFAIKQNLCAFSCRCSAN
jgi:hypothetical protein